MTKDLALRWRIKVRTGWFSAASTVSCSTFSLYLSKANSDLFLKNLWSVWIILYNFVADVVGRRGSRHGARI